MGFWSAMPLLGPGFANASAVYRHGACHGRNVSMSRLIISLSLVTRLNAVQTMIVAIILL